MTTYRVDDPWQLGDIIASVTDISGRTRVAYRDACGVLRDICVGVELCDQCDEPADECRCGAQQVMEDAA